MRNRAVLFSIALIPLLTSTGWNYASVPATSDPQHRQRSGKTGFDPSLLAGSWSGKWSGTGGIRGSLNIRVRVGHQNRMRLYLAMVGDPFECNTETQTARVVVPHLAAGAQPPSGGTAKIAGWSRGGFFVSKTSSA